MPIKKGRKPAKGKTTKRRKKVGTGASCETKTYKSPARAEGAAAMARSILPKSKKVTVDGKKVIICP